MKKMHLLLFVAFLMAAMSCQKKDIRELRSELDKQKELIAQLQTALNNVNTDIKSLQAIATAMQSKISVVSYTTTANGYELTMSDGSKINLNHGKDGANGTNGKDGINAPVIGLKQDADGNYYWTIGGDWLLQNGQKVKANGTNGNNGTTPLLMVNATSNQWMVSYDNGNTWSTIKDGNGNPITATGAQGPQGQPGAQGPAGIAGFGIIETDAAIIITYGGTTYTLPKESTGTGSNLPFMVFNTTIEENLLFGLTIDAALADRADVWIDLNNNKTQEPGEKVNVFGQQSTYKKTASETITIYGKVTKFLCAYRKITALDVSNNTALVILDCNNNDLDVLDVSKNTALTQLYCNSNQLGVLHVSKNIALTHLECFSNQLSALDVSKNTALTQLYCFNNQLATLDVSKNIELTHLQCFNNQLNVLDLSKCPKLTAVACNNNQISELDLSHNPALIGLDCFNNQIKDAAIVALINSLPNSSIEKSADIFDGRPMAPDEGNTLPTTQEVLDAAKAKKWKLYKYNPVGPLRTLLNP